MPRVGGSAGRSRVTVFQSLPMMKPSTFLSIRAWRLRGGLILLWPQALLPLLGVWLLCLMLTGYVGLSTILAAISLVFSAWWFEKPPVYWAFAAVGAVLLTYSHRSNLQRQILHNMDRIGERRMETWPMTFSRALYSSNGCRAGSPSNPSSRGRPATRQSTVWRASANAQPIAVPSNAATMIVIH